MTKTDDIFRRAAERNRADSERHQQWLTTPEGIAWQKREQRLTEADARYAEQHPEPEEPDEDQEDDEESEA